MPDQGIPLAETPGQFSLERVPGIDPTPEDALTVTAQDEVRPFADPGRLERICNVARHNKAVVAAGIITVASLATNPLGETLDALKETAPYVIPGMIAAEAAWIGGAAMMLSAVGKRTLNLLKIKAGLGEVTDATVNSRVFKAGLVTNTAAALAECAIPVTAVTSNLPAESWGILAFSTLDLWATVVLRRAIWRGMRK